MLKVQHTLSVVEENLLLLERSSEDCVAASVMSEEKGKGIGGKELG